MNLVDFKNYIDEFPSETKFEFSISYPFSWRGSYDGVAFKIIQNESTKEEILEMINKAYSEKFYGYKGGEYRFDDYTPINFEEDSRKYTDGGYCADWIAKIEEKPAYESQEKRLISMLFPK
jgi:hypothetical protein